GGDAEGVGFVAQHLRAEAVKGADTNPTSASSEQGKDAVAHLAGGAVGERQTEDMPRGDAAADGVSGAVSDDGRLAGAGGSEDEKGATEVRDGLALLFVKVVEPHDRRGSSGNPGRTGRVGKGDGGGASVGCGLMHDRSPDRCQFLPPVGAGSR